MDWLTTEEAAKYLKVRPRTLLVWARAGVVIGHSIGLHRKTWRFLREELDRSMHVEYPSPRLTAVLNEEIQ